VRSPAAKARRTVVAEAFEFNIRPLFEAAAPASADLAAAVRATRTKLSRVKPHTPTPNALSITDALQGSVPLVRLREALRDSNARFEAVRPAIPRLLLPHVKPGPVDAEGWSLLAANPAVAAKLRHLGPRLEDLLREGGWSVCAVRIKVTSA
jgi:hypothetical protein